MQNDSIIKVVSEQVATEIGGEMVILHLKSGQYYGLNSVGLRIWELLQRTTSVGQILETLITEYDAPPASIERDLEKLLDSLLKAGLIEVVHEAKAG